MNFKEAYYYLFYKLYKSFEAAPSKWWSDWKAVLSLLVLESWLLLSVMNYYKVFTKKDLIVENNLPAVSITIVALLVIIKYFAFEYKERWKDWVIKFDQLPKPKNRIGTLVTWLIVLLVVINLIFSFYLLSQINWKQYS